MRPWETLGRAPAPGGGELVLQRRGEEFVIRVHGQQLMSSRLHGSEEAMARLGCAGLRSTPGVRVLVGGLGLGYTLRAALNVLGPGARLVVAELSAALVEWNRGVLAPLAGRPLEDPRVQVEVADVRQVLLDVDNGPAALSLGSNAALYGSPGLAAAHAALVPGGTLVVWSAGPDERFRKRLAQAGFHVETHRVPAGQGSGAHHTLFVARSL